MNSLKKIPTLLFSILLSEESRERIDKIILFIALLSFIIHLGIICLFKFGLLPFESDSILLTDPISSVYTPFSFILIYEVYLLIFYLPKSFTTYVAKQYEIITLIIIRRLFKDLPSLELSSNWFDIKGDLQFTYDILASLALFYLIFLFQQQGKRKFDQKPSEVVRVERFIRVKKVLAVVLVPLFFVMACYTLITWSAEISFVDGRFPSLESINNLFFEDFFTVLILVDVILLLNSFFYTYQFHKIIRNSGFVVSTILIRMSFGVSGLINCVLIITAVLFGLIIILIHNKFEKSTLAEKEYN